MFVFFTYFTKGFTAVVRDMHPYIHLIYAVESMRVRVNLLVIMRTGAVT